MKIILIKKINIFLKYYYENGITKSRNNQENNMKKKKKLEEKKIYELDYTLKEKY